LEKLELFICSDHQVLQGLSLRLALNLSHDKDFRGVFLKHTIAVKMVPILGKKNYLMVSLQLLYQLSIDKENRSSPIFEEIIPNVINNLLDYWKYIGI
jgi:hypothetical protein